MVGGIQTDWHTYNWSSRRQRRSWKNKEIWVENDQSSQKTWWSSFRKQQTAGNAKTHTERHHDQIRAPADSVVTASAISLHYGKQRWLLFPQAIGQGQLKTLWTCGKPSFWSRCVFLPCLSPSLWPLSPFLPPSLLTGSCSVSLTSFKLPQRPDCPQISQ